MGGYTNGKGGGRPGIGVPPAQPFVAQPMIEEDDDDDIKVVANYNPRIASSGTAGPMVMIDPLSGKTIPVASMEEHMRVQLLDPKWIEQQRRFVDKQKDTGFAEGGSIADSLRTFARKRGDIFGQAAGGVAENSAMAIAREAKMEQAKVEATPQWDGYYGSIGMVKDMTRAAPNFPVHQPSSLPVSGPSIPSDKPYNQMQQQSSSSHNHSQVPPAYIPLPTSSYSTMRSAPPPTPAPISTPASIPPIMASRPTPGYSAPTPAYSASMPSSAPLVPSSQQPSRSLGTFSSGSSMVFSAGGGAPPPPPSSAPSTGGAPIQWGSLAVGDTSGSQPPHPKKQKTDSSQSIEAFCARHSEAYTITVTVPKDESSAFNLQGQSIPLSLMATATIKEVKELLSAHLASLPAGKYQLKAATGFLKDTQSLAACNLGPNSLLEISMKTRGGKK